MMAACFAAIAACDRSSASSRSAMPGCSGSVRGSGSAIGPPVRRLAARSASTATAAITATTATAGPAASSAIRRAPGASCA
jgi:hypothetical protein